MTEDQMEALARGNIESNLGSDLDGEEPSADAIYSDAYTLAFDALHDAGVERGKARAVADRLARNYAQP